MQKYVGRFAPSPTGPLHFGSLLTAVASYLDAKSHQGTWLVRIEDLDPPREMAGAAEQILSTLESYGLHWDGEITFQSERHHIYEDVIQTLLTRKQAFYCTCSRKQLSLNTSQPNRYPGTCREQHSPPSSAHSIRLKVDGSDLCINDALQGHYCQHLTKDVGDFIIKRKDQLFAYHLAVVIDDHWQQVSHVVRGIDLLDSTPRQCYLQQILNYETPQYSHLPIAVNNQGQKLSKQTFAKAIETTQSRQTLWTAMSVLGLQPPKALRQEPPENILKWGINAWKTDKLIGLTRIASNEIAFYV